MQIAREEAPRILAHFLATNHPAILPDDIEPTTSKGSATSAALS